MGDPFSHLYLRGRAVISGPLDFCLDRLTLLNIIHLPSSVLLNYIFIANAFSAINIENLYSDKHTHTLTLHIRNNKKCLFSFSQLKVKLFFHYMGRNSPLKLSSTRENNISESPSRHFQIIYILSCNPNISCLTFTWFKNHGHLSYLFAKCTYWLY